MPHPSKTSDYIRLVAVGLTELRCLLRRTAVGYLLAVPMLVMCTLVGVVVLAQTIAQTLAGITLSTGAYIGSVVSWIILGAWAIWLTISYLRSLTDQVASHSASGRPMETQPAR